MATIVILEHELHRHIGLPYMVRPFSERWRACGHSVLVHYGTGNPPPGDVAILHVDLTVVPQAYRALAAGYSRVINGKVLDVSKSRFSQDVVRPDASWQGPVIVKTEANFGGKPEQLLREIAARTGARCETPAGPLAEGYPTYASMREVPQAVWRTPGLMVEKFLPEQDEHGYYLRVWTFFGDRERCSRWLAREPIVKANNIARSEPVPVPDEIRAWRAKLGFDFGKFDFVRHDGRWVLLDANRTPSARPGPVLGMQLRERLDFIADGLQAFVR